MSQSLVPAGDHAGGSLSGAGLQFLADQLLDAMGLDPEADPPPAHQNNWSQADVVLITYADTVQRPDEKPLVTLKRFLDDCLRESVTAVHILPFFPYSSDDGFAVMDYLAVNESHGSWDDIEAIAQDYKLMADLVINHMSARSRWFENFRKRVGPGKDYFVEANPKDDLSQVVRPRTSPLLNPVQTEDGERYVGTFSEDQVDLNFANPEVLIEFVGMFVITWAGREDFPAGCGGLSLERAGHALYSSAADPRAD